MQKDAFQRSVAPVALALIMMLSCASAPHIVGKWKQTGKNSTFEFREDGTFKCVDDMGMAVSGKYVLQKNGAVKFEIIYEDSTTDILNGNITVRGAELTLTSVDQEGKEVEKYIRQQD